ncbi:MAG: nucleotidyltransferase family protein [Cyclobacteriaceae bacterium]|nr:nucleotidyltransferase family protein [Cyclobacteriaceae bacterium]
MSGAEKTGIILLAAGGSRRMGSPKQLLKIGDEFLINHIIKILLSVPDSDLVVVLGGNHKSIEPILQNKNHFRIVINEEWESGMASSIQKGVRILENESDSILMCTVDQPEISLEHLLRMRKIFTDSKSGQMGIVASSYLDTLGIPVLFDKRFFKELLKLQGDVGAKAIFQKNKESVTAIPFPKGEVDLDTEEEYRLWIKNSFHQSN